MSMWQRSAQRVHIKNKCRLGSNAVFTERSGCTVDMIMLNCIKPDLLPQNRLVFAVK